jgi:hypothetical protein
LFRNQTVGLGIEKNGGGLFRRPKLTLSSSAEEKEGRNVENIFVNNMPVNIKHHQNTIRTVL